MLDFPTLRILPIKDLVLHEWHDAQRTPPLIGRMRASRVLRNPPIVTPLGDGTGRHLVLDGANRTTAFLDMGIPHILAQVVQPEATDVDLKSWNHVLWGMRPEDFLQGVRGVAELELHPITSDEDAYSLADRETVAWIQTTDGSTYAACTLEAELLHRIQALNALVDSYKNQAQMDRTRVQKIHALNGLYNDLCALVVFPPFEIEEVLELCGAGHLFPSGTTRFSVSPRALRMNYPIEALEADIPLEEKNQTLEKWINEKLESKGVRFYAEATVLFDE